MRVVDYYDVVEAAEAAGLDEDAVRPGYSGRFMYGEVCLAVVGDMGEVMAFASEAAEREVLDSGDLSEARQDSMGRRMVAYWPGIQVSGAPEEED